MGSRRFFCLAVGVGYATDMKSRLLKDQYRTARGGYSRLLKIACEKCGAEVCSYQKDGPGNVRRMYIDRISKPKVSLITKHIFCPNHHLLGVKVIYEKEKRMAFRMFVDAIRKKVVKL